MGRRAAMVTRARLTPEQLRRIVELRDRHWSMDAIAVELGCSFATIAYHLLKLGHELSRPAPLPKARRSISSVRNGREVRPFTADEDRHLLEMARRQASYSDMARALDRRPHTCADRLRRLYRHIDRGTAIGAGLGGGSGE